ncbi:NTP transferase domain-containing protein [Gordonia crocea]|uniref:Molybdopterin molybdenumtransferase n=1 Tax=Gordonia crocea TaxID=589162 RepID=A0A7I9UX59_9ACTN|nr:NTP transferase domain-containing protein [Gordonia crocea]GED97533.1 hypothetical protein nbrc107697_15720 [Gordonia crocea]
MDRPTVSSRFDAVILAGGRARRLAGADKPASLVGGRRLIDIALAAVADAGTVVVVGPDRDLPDHVRQVREDPPFAGPAAAVAAGFAALGDLPDDRAVAVLAADLPFLRAAHIEALADHRDQERAPVALALDEEDQPQYLVGVWRAGSLRAALTGADASMRSLIPAEAAALALVGLADVDTPDDLADARRQADPVAAITAAAAALDPLAPADRAPDADVLGAVLAEPLRAVAPFPAFDTSAMDGYAVRGPAPWRLVGSAVRAGHDAPALTEPGSALPIATGAVLPPGAERVIRYEEVVVVGDNTLTSEVVGRDDTRRRGDSWAAGDDLLPAGTVVDAAAAGTARAAGVPLIRVRGPLRAVLHTSGDEVGADTGSGIADTASLPVTAALHGFGVRVTPGPHLPDSAAAMRAALGPDRTPGDVVIIIGATGRGAADHLRTALSAAGGRILLDGVPVRPGGSLLLAALPDGGAVVGLGGNPVAALTGAALCVPPVRDALVAAAPVAPEHLRVTGATALAHPRLWRAVPIDPDGVGGWVGRAVDSTAELRSLAGSRGLALLPPTGVGLARRLI